VHYAFLMMHLSSQLVAEIRHLQIATGFDCGSRSECSGKMPTGKVIHTVPTSQVSQAAAECQQALNIHEYGKAQQVYRVPHSG
jgi:hypothetical protein